MGPKVKKATAKASQASKPEVVDKAETQIAKKQAPTAASSRPQRRATKPVNNELIDGPKPKSTAQKRKRPMIDWDAEVEEAKKKGNTKKGVGDLEPGEMSIATDNDGLEKITTHHKAAIDITRTPHGARSFWLMKAEPLSRMEKGKDVKFSIDDLRAAKEPEGWDGVRNMAARNNMRAMKEGDLAFFYHSNCPKPGIAGTMAIVKEHTIDRTAHDPDHPYYDPKSTEDNPKWSLVHVEFRRKFPDLVTLKELQQHSKKPGSPLENLQTLKQSRLSVSKVSSEEWTFINNLAMSKEDNLMEGLSLAPAKEDSESK